MKKFALKAISLLVVALMVCTMLPLSAFAATDAGVVETAYHDFWPNTDTYNIVSGYNSQTGRGTVVLTDDVPEATDYAYTKYWGSHYLGDAKGFTWITVQSSDSDVVTATVKVGTHPTQNRPCLVVDFVKGTKQGTATITVGFTVTQLKVESGIATDGDTSYAVNGKLVYNVTNNASNSKDITLTYDANGGSGAPATETQTVSTGSQATFTVSDVQPTKEGSAFLGWADTANATEAAYQAGDKIPTAENKVLYAVWEELYSVTYTDGVDGEEIFADQVYTDLKAGDATPAFEGTPSREGYFFRGWTPDVEATVSGNAVYTAVWEKDPVLSVEALDYDEDIVLSEIVSNEYYRIRVVTEGYVEKIGLYNEYGLKLIVRDLTCTTNDDGTLTWIGYTTTETVGDARTLYIKPTVDGELKESLGSYTVKILPSTPVVRSAVIEDETAAINVPFTMTVVTDKTVSKLHIYNQNGLKLGGFESSYVEEGNDRIWTVKLSVGSAGNGRWFKVVGANSHSVLSDEVATSNTIDVRYF